MSLDSIPKVAPPNDGFILIVDCDGDPQEVFCENTNIDYIFQLCQKLDNDSDYSPHSVWKCNSGIFYRIFERL